MIRLFLSVAALNIFSGVLGALLLLSLGSMLAPAAYASFVLIQLTGQALFCFGADWSNHLLLRYGHEEFLKTGSVRSAIRGRTAILMLSFPIAIAGLAAIRPWALPSVDGPRHILLSVLYASSLILLGYAQYLLQAIDQISRGIWLTCLYRLISIGTLALLWAAGFLSGGTAILILIAGAVLSAAWGWVGLRPVLAVPPVAPFDRAILWKYSLPIAAETGLGFLYNWISVFLANHFWPGAVTGTYALAQQMVMFLTVGLASTNPILINHFVGRMVAGSEAAALRNFSLAYLHRLVFVWNVVLVGMLGVLHLVFEFVLPPAYHPGSTIVAILLPACGILAISGFLTPVIHVYSLTHLTMWASLAGILANLSVSLHLAPKLGTPGLAIGTAFGIVTASVLYTFIAISKVGAGWPAIWRFFLAAAPLIFFCAGKLSLAGSVWPWMAAGAATAAVYLAVCPPTRSELSDWRRRLGV